MKDMMKYKGYLGSVHFSDEDNLFYGKLEFIRALVSYEGTDVKTLRRAFEAAVDDYLQMCSEIRQERLNNRSRDHSMFVSVQTSISV